MVSFRKQPLYPTTRLETMARTEKDSQPISYSQSQPSRQHGTPPITSELGFDIDDDFIQEQRAILERIQTRQDAAKAASAAGQISPQVIDRAFKTEPVQDFACLLGEADNQEVVDIHESEALLLSDLEFIQEHQRRALDQIRRDSQVSRVDNAGEKALDDDLELEYIQEHQNRVLEQIQRDSKHKRADSCRDAVDWANEVPRVKGGGLSSNQFPSSSDDYAPKEENIKLQDTTRDCTKELSNGKKIKLKGTKHVLKAISNGTAILVSCAGCQTVLQVPSSCTAVFCYLCHQVTPMELARSISSSSGVDDDSKIAIALQQQELDAACARKMSES